MELDEHGYFEGQLLQRREMWDAYFYGGIGDLFPYEDGSCFDEGGGEMGSGEQLLQSGPGWDAFGLMSAHPVDFSYPNPATYCGLPPPLQRGLGDLPTFSSIPSPSIAPITTAVDTMVTSTPVTRSTTVPCLSQEEQVSSLQMEDQIRLLHEQANHLPWRVQAAVSKMEELVCQSPNVDAVGGQNRAGCDLAASFSAAFDMGSTSSSSSTQEKKSRAKKVDGKPSKNLLAERRRRKRLNDRLSMLRSVVPKISKMDRTSILSDTIVYMKELLDRINHLSGEMGMKSTSGSTLATLPEGPSPPRNPLSLFRTDLLGAAFMDAADRNGAPKFNVERGEVSTQVEIYCARNPGLLLSILGTLEELGLEIQQGVISCLNEFGMRASCCEDVRTQGGDRAMSSEDMKQALFKTAGYRGRCV